MPFKRLSPYYTGSITILLVVCLLRPDFSAVAYHLTGRYLLPPLTRSCLRRDPCRALDVLPRRVAGAKQRYQIDLPGADQRIFARQRSEGDQELVTSPADVGGTAKALHVEAGDALSHRESLALAKIVSNLTADGRS